MSINLEIIGTIHHIAETVFVTDKFSKREFVILVQDEKNPKYDDFLQLQMTGDKCDLLDGLAFGGKVKAQVNVRGRMWEKKDGSGKAYFNTLEAWKIEVVEKAHQEPESISTPEFQRPQEQAQADDQSLPF